MSSTVSFHTGVGDPIRHALKIIRKAVAQELKVCTVGPAPSISALDELLWTFDPASFIPHVRWAPEVPQAEVNRSAVVLIDESHAEQKGALESAPDVLINLGLGAEVLGPDCPRIVEIIGAHDEARRQGQVRWKRYRDQGITPAHHALSPT